MVFIGALAVTGAVIRADESPHSQPIKAASSVQSSVETQAPTADNNAAQAPASPTPNQSHSSSSSVNTSVTESNGSAQVTINGQPVAVPDNGSTHKTMTTPNGNISYDINTSNTTSGFSNTSIDVSSSSVVNITGGQ